MIKNTVLFMMTLLIGIGFVVSVHTPQYVSAQASLVCDGLSPDQAGGDCSTDPANAPSVNSVLEIAIGFLSLAVGVIAVIMLIIAGVKYVTSQGDSSKVSSAKNTVIYAIIGLIIAALAQAIVYFVLDSAINPDTTQPTQVTCPRGKNCPQ